MDNENFQNEQPPQEPERRSSSQGNFNVWDAVNRIRRRRRNLSQLRTVMRAAKVINTVTNLIPQVRAAKYIIICVIIFILLIIFLLIGDHELNNDSNYYGAGQPSPAPVPSETATPIPGLSLEKSGPSSITNGEEITYTINARYNGNLDVTIIDRLPTNTQYVEASGVKVVDNPNSQVSWRLSENTPIRVNEVEGLNIYSFTLKIRPTQNDIYVENSVFATAPGGTTGPAPETNDFVTLMQGQGRNTTVLGDENNFVETAVKHYSQFRNNQSLYEPYLRDIYKISVSYQVNPAIVLTIWGVEQSFAINGREFGCKPFDTGFDTQVDCSATTLNNHMKRFEEIKAQQNGQLPVYYKTETSSCPYWEPFIYTYEAYTPVCTLNDGNDGARKNFVDIYKQLLYGVQ